ncbi:hypothetical protein EJB05_04047, partial [Eragrostis curvula]
MSDDSPAAALLSEVAGNAPPLAAADQHPAPPAAADRLLDPPAVVAADRPPAPPAVAADGPPAPPKPPAIGLPTPPADSSQDFLDPCDNSIRPMPSGNIFKSCQQEEFKQQHQNPAPLQQEPEVGNQQTPSVNMHVVYPVSGGEEQRSYKVPENLYHKLRPHQQDGLLWLWTMHCKRFPGGLISDDMGLGKTLQTTIFLSGLFHSEIIKTVIIIAPLTVLDSWVAELKESGLKRRVQQHHLSGDEGINFVAEGGGIFLTSYDKYRNNAAKFLDKHWDYVVLDEAHKIKTYDGGIRKSLEKIKCLKKILLTGTPIPRDPLDLFSLMDFIKKGLFGNLAKFKGKYMGPFQRGFCLVQHFRKKIYPHMLRRTKSVLIESGVLKCKKNEIIVWLSLAPVQVKLYSELCKQFSCLSEDDLIHKPSFPELKRELFDEEKIDKDAFEKGKKGCVKRKILKILIFSYHIPMLKKIKEALKVFEKETDIIQIDGTVLKEERKRLIENEGPRIFLLSAKVGGEGLNLIAATRVIVLDPSWNLSDDNQIADRVYRYGQTEDVTIYRLFTCQTIEEHMYKTQLVKGYLAQAVIDGKFCSSMVKKGNKKVLSAPKTGFHISPTQQLIKRRIGTSFQINPQHLLFLERHTSVSGLTNQNLVFSKIKTFLDDLSDDESDKDVNVARKVNKAHDKNAGTSSEAHVWRKRLRIRRVTGNQETSKENDGELVVSEGHMEIPTYKVPALLGPCGDTIRDLQMRSSTKIHVDTNKAGEASPFTAVSITGTKKERERAQNLIDDVLSKANEDYLVLPTNQVRLVKRTTLQEIQQKTGAKINGPRSGGDKPSVSGKAGVAGGQTPRSPHVIPRETGSRTTKSLQHPVDPSGFRTPLQSRPLPDPSRSAEGSYGLRPLPLNTRRSPVSEYGVWPPPFNPYRSPGPHYGARPPGRPQPPN